MVQTQVRRREQRGFWPWDAPSRSPPVSVQKQAAASRVSAFCIIKTEVRLHNHSSKGIFNSTRRQRRSGPPQIKLAEPAYARSSRLPWTTPHMDLFLLAPQFGSTAAAMALHKHNTVIPPPTPHNPPPAEIAFPAWSWGSWHGEKGILSNTGNTVCSVFSFPPSLEIALPTVWPRQRSQAFREEDIRLCTPCL